MFSLKVGLLKWLENVVYIYIYSPGKGSLLPFQRVLNNSCEPEHWYIQRTDEENTIYSVLRVSCYQSSAKLIT